MDIWKAQAYIRSHVILIHLQWAAQLYSAGNTVSFAEINYSLKLGYHASVQHLNIAVLSLYHLVSDFSIHACSVTNAIITPAISAPSTWTSPRTLMFQRLRCEVDVFSPLSSPSPDRPFFQPRYLCLLFSSPKLIRLFPRLWAGSCSCRLDPQRQRNAGGYSDGRLKMNRIHTHTHTHTHTRSHSQAQQAHTRARVEEEKRRKKNSDQI